MSRSLSTMGRLSALLAVGASVLVAQGTQIANVNGEVVTPNGAPIAGVMVRLTSPALQGTRVVTTDEKGRFVARLLPPGTYTIVLNKDGMQQVKATSTIGIGQTFEPRYQMAPVGGAVVEVVSSVGEIDKTDVKTATNYALDKVDQLPNARTMEAVALLTPGVTAGVGNRPQIRGAMTSGNLYLLDGQNISDNAYNNKGVRTIDDSIEEVQIITGAISAEYGGVDGGVLNAITKSGGNEYAGQIRWELKNPMWNARQPYQSMDALGNMLSEEKTISVSGYLIKDKLWFAGSFFNTDQNGTGTIGEDGAPIIPVYNYYDGPGTARGWQTPTGPGGTAQNYWSGNGTSTIGHGATFATTHKEIRRQIKLTWAINQNHTLVGAFNNAQSSDGNRDYSAGDLKSLVPQIGTSEFINLQWRAVWSNSITSEVKVGHKKQMLSAGADIAGGSPIYNYNNGDFYHNGIFNSNDGGDNRNNETANAKVSYFLEAAGTHQMDAGIDHYKGISRARNEQSPTGYIFGVKRMNLGLEYANPQDVWVFTSTPGEAHNISDGLYFNDKWSLNRNLTFNLGVRYDKFSSQKENGVTTASATSLSPRLGLKYDVMADAKYVFGAGYARYNAKAPENILNSVTGQGHPTEIDHPWMGAPNSLGAPLRTFADIINLADLQTNYNYTKISYFGNPAINVALAPGLKAPSVVEVQASFQVSFNSPTLGNGSVKVTGVHKKWDNLLDYSQGNSGQVATPTGDLVYMKVWDNSSVAERKYKGLELEGLLNNGPWSLGGNVTWSELKGNYEGEGSSSPARGEGLQSYTIQDGVRMYDSNVINSPYGYLQGHVPIRIRANASYLHDGAYGKTTWGVVYRFDAGSRYSISRNTTAYEINPNLSSQFSQTDTQYLGERGGGGVFNGATYVDLAITHDFPLFKAYGKTVSGFFKLVIGNVFNHQQILSWDTSYGDTTPDANGGTSAGYGLNTPWAKSSTYGAADNNNYYASARTFAISTGVRF